MGRSQRRKPLGFTLVELVVVLAIIFTFIGLLLPAIQKARESANLRACANKLGQLGLASHSAYDTYQKLPPALGYYPQDSGSTGYGSGLFHLLPFLEEDVLYHHSAVSTPNGPLYQGAQPSMATRPVKMYICPSDPSAPAVGLSTQPLVTDWGVATYAMNFQVFGRVDNPTGATLGWDGAARIPASFPDGTSNTILFAEKYASCGSRGNLWDNYDEDAWAPAFAVSNYAGDLGFSPPATTNVGTASKFQHKPNPFLTNNCNPALASGPHDAGISVCMADATVRTIGPQVSATTWWYFCTPAGGDLPGPDW
jgi:type II secretory pathway pseudopilin PulG